MLEQIEDYILKQIENLSKAEQCDILLELSGDLAIMAESYE